MARSPEAPAQGAKSDPLTEILTLAKARCVMSSSLLGGGSWALRFPPPAKIKFVALVKGVCWLTVEGAAAPLRIETGDVFMLSAERAFALAADLDAPHADGAALFAAARDNVARVGQGEDFLAIGGHVELDAERGAVLAEVLPPLLHIDGKAPQASTMRYLLEQLVMEAAGERHGAVLATQQLAQLLLIHIIRAYLAGAGPVTLGWLGALVDERIAPALRLMHGAPGRDWQLGELARELGMSRTSFALRFKAATGVAPLSYLRRWRMRLAQQGLREGGASVAALAGALGYASESAFSNAFKRSTGMAPKRYRSGVAGVASSADDAADDVAPGRAPFRVARLA